MNSCNKNTLDKLWCFESLTCWEVLDEDENANQSLLEVCRFVCADLLQNDVQIKASSEFQKFAENASLPSLMYVNDEQEVPQQLRFTDTFSILQNKHSPPDQKVPVTSTYLLDNPFDFEENLLTRSFERHENHSGKHQCTVVPVCTPIKYSQHQYPHDHKVSKKQTLHDNSIFKDYGSCEGNFGRLCNRVKPCNENPFKNLGSLSALTCIEQHREYPVADQPCFKTDPTSNNKLQCHCTESIDHAVVQNCDVIADEYSSCKSPSSQCQLINQTATTCKSLQNQCDESIDDHNSSKNDNHAFGQSLAQIACDQVTQTSNDLPLQCPSELNDIQSPSNSELLACSSESQFSNEDSEQSSDTEFVRQVNSCGMDQLVPHSTIEE